MKKIFITFLSILFASKSFAFPILDIQLQKKMLKAGDLLEISVMTKPDFELKKDGGTNVYLGHIVNNVFASGGAVNRSATKTYANTYTLNNLQINPWVFSDRPEYRVEQFMFYEEATLKEFILWAGESTYFFYHDETWTDTLIPVLTFSILDNPNSDVTAPVIRDLEVIQKNKFFDVLYSVDDENSGYSENEFVSILLPNQGLINISPRKIGDKRFILEGLKVENPGWISDPTKIPVGIMISDRSGNFGSLSVTPESDKYIDHSGFRTSIPIQYISLEN